MNIRALANSVFLSLALLFSLTAHARDEPGVIPAAHLPPEARQTLSLIRQGGPFPYPKDGSVFGNYEGLLPRQTRGYYHEYTVRTPGVRSRGARRIVAGGKPPAPQSYYYTDDHYATFKRVQE